MTQNPIRVIVIGIDPGVASTGFGVIAQEGGSLTAVDGGVIATSSDDALEYRLLVIHEQILALIDLHEPDALSVEEIYFGENARSAFAVGQGRGAAMLAGGRRAIPCHAYTPQAVKMAVCGNGGAAKDQVKRMIQMVLRLPRPVSSDHTADALAVALCHLNRAPLARVGAA